MEWNELKFTGIKKIELSFSLNLVHFSWRWHCVRSQKWLFALSLKPLIWKQNGKVRNLTTLGSREFKFYRKVLPSLFSLCNICLLEIGKAWDELQKDLCLPAEDSKLLASNYCKKVCYVGGKTFKNYFSIGPDTHHTTQ